MDGISKTRLYTIFSGMKQRCYNPNSSSFPFYGAKGITICSEWLGEDGLSRFIEWALNNGNEEHLTIDRINSHGPYSPENCQWVTKSENSHRVERGQERELEVYKIIPGSGLRYYRLFDLLRRRGLKKGDLAESANLSWPTMAKLAKGQSVNTEVISRICVALRCQPENIMEYVFADERTEHP